MKLLAGEKSYWPETARAVTLRSSAAAPNADSEVYSVGVRSWERPRKKRWPGAIVNTFCRSICSLSLIVSVFRSPMKYGGFGSGPSNRVRSRPIDRLRRASHQARRHGVDVQRDLGVLVARQIVRVVREAVVRRSGLARCGANR